MADMPEPPLYPYAPPRDLGAPAPLRYPVVVVGAGPVGLALALDLGLQGQPVLVLDDHEGPGDGSRAICFSKRSLEIADRYGCAAGMLDKGVVWNRGKVFHRDREIYEFDLLPEPGHRCPAFVNLQQPDFERFMVARIRQAQRDGAPIELRGRNRVEAAAPDAGGAELTVATPDGSYRLRADWLVACDGARSSLRGMLGLDFEGRVFRDSFLIADIRMTGPFPAERRFWFDPWFRSGASALMHKQPDHVWRIDFQIGWDVDRAEELKEDNVRRRLDAMLGEDARYDLLWTSIYTFQCRRMRRFRHGRVFFAGDSAHQVSPFGARGCNSGIQDAENLGWKLGMVLRGEAPEALLDSYCTERRAAADENIRHSTRSTDFITPKSRTSRLFRDAVLDLAARHPFARPMVNSGRLSQAASYRNGPLTGPDGLPGGPAGARPGAACPDAPLTEGYLLNRLGGGFTLLFLGASPPESMPAGAGAPPLRQVVLGAGDDPSGLVRDRYLGQAASAVYLVRPDQHIAARWPGYDAAAVRGALRLACGMERTE